MPGVAAGRGGGWKRRSDGCAGSASCRAGPRQRGGVHGKRRARFSTETAEHLAAREMSGIVPVYPSAEALGAAWLSLAEARREELLESPAEPLYVRAPHITRAKRPAWAVKA